MTEKTGTFQGAEGIEIFYRHYPASPEKARVVIAHGLGEHSGRYGNVVETLVPKGYSIWAPDHRGHGKSGGKRGHTASFDHFLADLGLMIGRAVEGRPDGMKLFLLGHSMGGLIALNFAQNFPELLDGLIASSPGLGLAIEVPAVKKVLGNVMSSIWPGLTMGNELDATKISRDPEVVKAYVDDPLVHDRVSTRFFTELIAAMERTNQGAPGLTMPTLMQVAGDDHLVNAETSRRFFDSVGAEDKTLHVYDGLYHEGYNELPEDRAKVLGDLLAWLEERA